MANIPYIRLNVNTDMYIVDTAGNWTNNVRAGAFINMSDIRFKEEITPLDPVLSKINNVESIRYKKKNGVGKEEIGFSAQNLLSVFPEFVTGQEDSVGYGVNYAQFTAVLTKAIQELNTKLEAAEALNQSLEARIAALENT